MPILTAILFSSTLLRQRDDAHYHLL